MEHPILAKCKEAIYRRAVGLSLQDSEVQRLMEALSMVHATSVGERMYFDDAVDAILARLRAVMISKQTDYGPRNILDCGQVGVVIRANDKLARLRNLYGITDGTFVKKAGKNESVDDSFVDLANYAIIALMLRNNVFDLPLRPKDDSQTAQQSAEGPVCSGCDSVQDSQCSDRCGGPLLHIAPVENR